MLDRPPPLPRWSRISNVSSTLVMMSSTTKVYANGSMAQAFLSASIFRLAKSSGLVGLHLRQSQAAEIGHAERRVDEPPEHVRTGQPERFLVQQRDVDRLLLDLLVQVAPQRELSLRVGLPQRRVQQVVDLGVVQHRP